jgi:hypothetical protein
MSAKTCPSCGAFLKEGETVCSKCGAKSLEKTPPPSRTYISFEEMGVDQLADILSTTIKRDRETKLITFYGILLNYTDNDQQNIAFSGPAALGKTHNALEVASYFPEEDVYPIAYSSPQAFFHAQGIPVDRDLNPIMKRADYVADGLEAWEATNPKPDPRKGVSDWKDKRAEERRRLRAAWDEIEKFALVDLEKKILIFLDMPHDELLQRLRPLLSHDRKILPIQITDQTKEGGHRTKNIILKGYPTVLFLAVNTSLEGQERSRNFLLSPEVSQEKFRETIDFASKVLSDRRRSRKAIEEDEGRRKLRDRVRAIKEAGISEILISEEDRVFIVSKFLAEHNHLQPRHQRDFPRLIALGKAHALLNFANRRRDGDGIWATRKDLEEGAKLYAQVSEANEAELPPHIFKFWNEKLKAALADGLTRKEISNLYVEFYHIRIGERALKKLIELLCEAGLVYEDKDPSDKRFTKIYVLGGGGEKIRESPIEAQSVRDELNLVLGKAKPTPPKREGREEGGLTQWTGPSVSNPTRSEGPKGEKVDEATGSPTGNEWDGFVAVGPMATPERNYWKTVQALHEFVELEHRQTISEDELESPLKLYWAESSWTRVTQRLLRDGILTHLGDGFKIDAIMQGPPKEEGGKPRPLCDSCFGRHRGAKVVGRPYGEQVCVECGDKATVIMEGPE